MASATATRPRTSKSPKDTPTAPSPAGAAPDVDQIAAEAPMLGKMISEPTRVKIVLMLADSELHVGEICSRLDQSQPSVSHHLALMRFSRSIQCRRQGKNNFYGLTERGRTLAQAIGALTT